MKKRFLSIVFSIIFACTFLSACEQSESLSSEKTHTHTWSDWVTENSATCTEQGKEKRSCNGCEEIEYKEIPATGHEWKKWYISKSPTCTEQGTETRECDTCGHTQSVPVVELGHDWSDWTELNPPTCAQNGNEKRVCNHDGGHTETRETLANCHTYNTPVWVWEEVETGFNVNAYFLCDCKNDMQTKTAFVSINDYVMDNTTSIISYAFTANIAFNGQTYSDTRYIKYQLTTIQLDNSNYKDYIGVGCGMAGYDIYTTISKKNENLSYSNVFVTFKVTLSGKYNINGYDGLYNYHNTFRITNTSLNGSIQYTDIGTVVYSASLSYTVSVSGSVSGYVLIEYLS